MSSAAVSVALVGLGKMGLSHLAMIRPHPDVRLVGVCDSAGYLLDVLGKYTGVATFTDYTTMLDQATPDAVLIATPSALHAPMVREALIRDIHVFCEKPLFLDPADGAELTALADSRGLVTQVGYHNKFVGAFQEVKRLLEEGAIGQVNTVQAQAYGPVVLKPAGKTWRSRRTTGGGCLYDYAAHPLDLVTWYLGKPEAVGGSRLTSIFSAEIDDAVTSTLYYPHGVTAQLTTNWSDESQRKMTTKVSLWGHWRTHPCRPTRGAGLSARHRSHPRRLSRRVDGALYHRADRGAVVLSARRGIQPPVGHLRAPSAAASTRRAEHLRLGLGHRRRDRDDRPGRRAGAEPRHGGH